MISINQIDYFLGDRVLFDHASLFIGPKDRIGLIGLNGTGKSTLLKMLVKDIDPSGGEISKSKDTTIGFLNQDLLSYESDEPILEVAMQAFREAHDLEHAIQEVIKEMEVNYHDKLVNKLSKLQERYEAIDGYTLQSRAEEILEGIGFETRDLQRPLREFSGGWRMRVMLARLLLERPSLLMLDEPTNHLDLPSIQWLENYLQTYDGACIIVSHDRRFLNSSINKIVEVFNKDLHLYAGNYDFYESEKEMRNEIQQNAYDNQQKHIKQTERFIERFKAKATKAKQAQSRVKQLEKLDRIDAVVDENAAVNFKFNFSTKSGRHVVRFQEVSKAYDDLKILDKSDAGIERGDKIALIGANGKGKSTVLRIVAGMEKFSGKVEKGHNVITSFYAQHQLESLGVDQEILEELKQAGTGKSDQELRGVLGCFLFSDEEVFKKIKVLSGGERSRVALAKTLISEANFLMLDEPTNHLDIVSVSILVQALQQYEGTFLLVSHDRDFISKVATKIWYIEDEQVKEYPGTYQEYEWWSSQQASRSQDSVPQKEKSIAKKEPAKQKPAKTSDDKQRNKLKKEVADFENQISTLEDSASALEKDMASPQVINDAEQLSELSTKYEKAKQSIEALTVEWEAASESLESLD
ncbi:MAG: ATP-binding cassette subfamily F protein 3 [Cyclobacteriaceae bacterium]|jgi:ATP-binding cassette subfamily F protein 3